jgi:hypothetical protein
MFRLILTFGLAAGVIVAAPLFLALVFVPGADSMLVGYLIMILAFSLIFVGVKRHRDRELGGVIRFVPALLAGLGVSLLASFVYVIGWEITLALTHFAFVDTYAAALIDSARAKGGSPADIARAMAAADDFRRQYANPLYRLPMTFIEIFPVGVVVSLISAALLRNRRFLPANA